VKKEHPFLPELMNIIERQSAEITRLQERVEGLEVELEQARNDVRGPRPPSGFKPNSPERKGQARRRKKRPEGFARKRSIASRQVLHALDG